MSSRSRYIIANTKRKTAAIGRYIPAHQLYAKGAPNVRKQIADKIRAHRKGK